jgi:hypothetical protein
MIGFIKLRRKNSNLGFSLTTYAIELEQFLLYFTTFASSFLSSSIK